MTQKVRRGVLSDVRVYEDSRTFGHVWTSPSRLSSDCSDSSDSSELIN
jgi:hypothetical protein